MIATAHDLTDYYSEKSVAAPLRGMAETGFRHIELSMYCINYEGSPWRTDKTFTSAGTLGTETLRAETNTTIF